MCGNSADKPIKCISCGHTIAQGGMTVGRIIIKCRCGVSNTIQAENKPEGRKYIMDHEPVFDGRGRLMEISMVRRRTT